MEAHGLPQTLLASRLEPRTRKGAIRAGGGLPDHESNRLRLQPEDWETPRDYAYAKRIAQAAGRDFQGVQSRLYPQIHDTYDSATNDSVTPEQLRSR